jgi:hypothetical protein
MPNLTAWSGRKEGGSERAAITLRVHRERAMAVARLRLARPTRSTGGLPLRSSLRDVPERARLAPHPLRNHSGGGPDPLPLRGVARAKRAQKKAGRRRPRRCVAPAVAEAPRAQARCRALGLDLRSRQMKGEHCSPLKLPLRGVATRDRLGAITATRARLRSLVRG